MNRVRQISFWRRAGVAWVAFVFLGTVQVQNLPRVKQAAFGKTADGAEVGVAIVPRGGHPPKTWHCPRDIRMLNPAITAPAAVVLKGGAVTTLRYRVVAFDGAVPTALLDGMARKEAKE